MNVSVGSAGTRLLSVNHFKSFKALQLGIPVFEFCLSERGEGEGRERRVEKERETSHVLVKSTDAAGASPIRIPGLSPGSTSDSSFLLVYTL